MSSVVSLVKKKKHVSPPDIQKCATCSTEGTGYKNCGACQSVCYCSSKCQVAAWAAHKSICKLIKKEKAAVAEKKANQQLITQGRDRDMGNLINALVGPDLEFHESHIYNCCWDGQHEKLQKILKQDGLDVNWGEPDLGTTAVHAAASQGHNKCLLAIINHGGADLSRYSNKVGCDPTIALESLRSTKSLSRFVR
jgi:hypothetical protein